MDASKLLEGATMLFTLSRASRALQARGARRLRRATRGGEGRVDGYWGYPLPVMVIFYGDIPLDRPYIGVNLWEIIGI